MEIWAVGRARGSIGLLLGIVAVAGACGSLGPSSTVSDGASNGVPTLIPSASDTLSPASPPSPATSSPTSSVAIDPALLAVLPPSIDGRPVEEASAAEQSSAVDASLQRLAEGLAVGYVSSQSKQDWAIASIVALRPGPFGEAEFRGWRDTYESAVCAPVGGPAGHAQASIGGRTVYIGTCGGLRIYQVLLAAPARVVAVTSAGAADFGERLVSDLRP
ncbi:MAG TPA: hypothetical protein VF802_00660 [Candidatus Limnocylindrales bacterium]